MDAQRYISRELTHFVGRSLASEEQQFGLLVAILRSGELRAPRNLDGSPKLGMTVHANAGEFSERKIHEVPAVCFCDIPIADLHIHMDKYSGFGIAFEKRFLLGKGASPVFYIANDSLVDYKPNVDWAARLIQAGRVTRADFLNTLVYQFHIKQFYLHVLLANQSQPTPDGKTLDPQTHELLMQILMLMQGVDREFLSYSVPFCAALPDGHSDNFYMEREWRTIGDVRFELADVCRIILPRRWAQEFRLATPEYSAQVSFSG